MGIERFIIIGHLATIDRRQLGRVSRQIKAMQRSD
jgi:hypothetical protein